MDVELDVKLLTLVEVVALLLVPVTVAVPGHEQKRLSSLDLHSLKIYPISSHFSSYLLWCQNPSSSAPVAVVMLLEVDVLVVLEEPSSKGTTLNLQVKQPHVKKHANIINEH